MRPDDEILVSCFIDGQEVDWRRLATVVRSEEGAAVLADFLELRAELREEAAAPGDAFYRGLPAGLRRSGPTRRRWLIPLAAAAALFAVLAVTLPRPEAPEARSGPPTADRILAFRPGVDWWGAGEGEVRDAH